MLYSKNHESYLGFELTELVGDHSISISTASCFQKYIYWPFAYDITDTISRLTGDSILSGVNRNASGALSSAVQLRGLTSPRVLLPLYVACAPRLERHSRYLYKRKRRFHGHYLYESGEFLLLLGYRSGPGGALHTVRIYRLLYTCKIPPSSPRWVQPSAEASARYGEVGGAISRYLYVVHIYKKKTENH